MLIPKSRNTVSSAAVELPACLGFRGFLRFLELHFSLSKFRRRKCVGENAKLIWGERNTTGLFMWLCPSTSGREGKFTP